MSVFFSIYSEKATLWWWVGLQGILSIEFGKIIPVPVNDLKYGWVAADKLVKMSQNVNGIEIHYIYSSVLNAFTDFKFK